ncbi:MAG: glucosidase, partial [Gammaproteobacteria bacterium]
LWFRNTWGWGDIRGVPPSIMQRQSPADHLTFVADDRDSTGLTNLPFEYRLGQRVFYAEEGGVALFTDNETNTAAVYGADDGRLYTKDAFHRYLVEGHKQAVNPAASGTKACIHYHRKLPAGGVCVFRLRLSPDFHNAPLAQVDEIIAARLRDADEFYSELHPPNASDDERNIQRQALAGLMWSKQNYIFDVDLWLKGDNPHAPPPASRLQIRNQHWRHLNSMRILSMPDKWEYPWFAAWDLAFHTVPIALVDPDFAKEQLWLMLFEQFQHPNGQIPAYEWEFSDLNPPVHAWAVWRVYNMDRIRSGKADREFLEKCFHKLIINFAWWINKVDSSGNNIFEGGFLGLDNITVFDRSEKLAGGAVLEQSDATGWMGMYCLNLMRIALELARENPVYESLATKYFQHYVYVGAAMKHMGAQGDHNLWDEKDGFFYDVLRHPDGRYEKLRVRSLVGLIPLYAVERLEHNWIEKFADFKSCLHWFVEHRQDVVRHCVNRVTADGVITDVMTIVDPEQLKRIFYRMADPAEFRSDYGMRSLSRHHLEQPFEREGASVLYEAAEADCKIKGGNSNWRGPLWFPTTFLIIESLRKLRKAYADELRFVGSDGQEHTPGELAEYFANAMIAIFTRDSDGRRPVYADNERFQHDPHWRDYILFYEYFDGDTGRGLGASHQTGWTGLVASLIDEWRR